MEGVCLQGRHLENLKTRKVKCIKHSPGVGLYFNVLQATIGVLERPHVSYIELVVLLGYILS